LDIGIPHMSQKGYRRYTTAPMSSTQTNFIACGVDKFPAFLFGPRMTPSSDFCVERVSSQKLAIDSILVMISTTGFQNMEILDTPVFLPI